MPEGKGDIFTDALAESGVTQVTEETPPSTENQDLSTTEETTTETAVETTEETLSETQSAAAETTETAETTEEIKSKNTTGIVDFNPDETTSTEEASSSEQTQSSSNSINFNEMFGENYETAEDVQDRLEYADDLESQVEQLQNTSPDFANEFVKKMDEFVRGGGDPVKFAMFNGIEVDKLSPAEAIKLELQWTHNMTPGDAQVIMDSKYKTEDFDNEDGTKVDPASVYMSVDATSAKDNLRKIQADNTLVEAAAPAGLSEEQWVERQSEAQSEATEANDLRMWDEQSGWAPEVNKVVNNLQENGVMLDLGNGKGFNFAYDQNEEYTNSLIKKVDQALYDSGTSRQSDPELAKVIMETIFFAENKAAMFKAYGDEVRSMETEAYMKAVHNPSAIKKGAPVPKQNDKMASTEEQMSQLWK